MDLHKEQYTGRERTGKRRREYTTLRHENTSKKLMHESINRGQMKIEMKTKLYKIKLMHENDNKKGELTDK